MNYLYGDKDALPFSHTSTHLNEKYENERDVFSEEAETKVMRGTGKNYHFNPDRVLKLIDKLEGDRDTKEKLKNELIRLLMELSESKDKIVQLMYQLSDVINNFNKNIKSKS